MAHLAVFREPSSSENWILSTSSETLWDKTCSVSSSVFQMLGAASRAEVLQSEIVQRSIQGFFDHNYEELSGLYTRPTLDLYIANKYWSYLTKDLGELEIADLQKARDTLQHYERIYSLFEYGNDLTATMTCLETRIASNNPSVPMTIYRRVNDLILNLYSLPTTKPRVFSMRWTWFSRHTTSCRMTAKISLSGRGNLKMKLGNQSTIWLSYSTNLCTMLSLKDQNCSGDS